MNERIQSDIVLRAISRSAREHAGQVRKDGVTPYVAHPMRVMTVLVWVFGVEDPELLATAALHDTIEDTTVDFDDLLEEFGPNVARGVALLSKDTRLQEHERERAYVETLAQAPVGVQLCKLADVYDNLCDSVGLPAERRSRTVRKATEWLRVFGDRIKKDWAHVLDAVERQLERARSVA